MRLERDLQVPVARRAAIHSRSALAAQAQPLAVGRAPGNARGEAAPVELHRALGAAISLLQREAHRHLIVLARECRTAAEAAAAPLGAAEKSHRLEQLA